MEYSKKVLTAVSIGAFAIIIMLFLWKVSTILLLAFIGLLFGTFLRSTAKIMSSRTRLSTQTSLWIVLITFLSIAVIAALFAGPSIAEQIDYVGNAFPQIISQVGGQIERYQWGAFVMEQLSALEPDGQELLIGAKSILAGAAWIITGILVVLFVGLYTAIAPKSYWNGILALVPKRHRKKARSMRDEMETQLQRWLIGRMIAMTSVGILTIIGLLLLDVPLALTLGVIAGLLDFIPNIGPILAAVPAVLLALAVSPQLALYVIILYAVIQMIENYIVTPVVERRAVHLPPAFVLVLQLSMGLVFGFLGLLVATPLAVITIVLIKNLYVES